MISGTRIAVFSCVLATALGASESARSQESVPTRAEYFPLSSPEGGSLSFSEAVKVGSTLYVSGQIGNAPGTRTLAAGGIGPEARQALENLKLILERHGSSLEQVVKCTVFLADIKDWPAFNGIYREFFRTNFPARSALAANGLAFDARVEVDCIADSPPPIR